MNEVVKIQPIDEMQTAPSVTSIDPMVRMIERVASDETVSIERLERMMEMKERLDDKEAARQFNEALAACQAEMPIIAKNAANDQTRSKYATLSAIYATAKPIVASHGLSFSTFPATSEKPDHLGVRWTLRHTSGHVESDVAEIPVDNKGAKGTVNKTGTHAFGSSNTYARRYLFCMIFDVAVGEDDDGNTGGGKPTKLISDEQYITLRDTVGELGLNEETICRVEGIQKLMELPASKFQHVMRRLDDTRKEQQAAMASKDDGMTIDMESNNA